MKISELRTTMVEALREEVASVNFTKKDGTERVMKCTLQAEFLPIQEPKKEGYSSKKVNEDVVVVFDTEAQGFRSFRLDSVNTFTTSTVSMNDVKALFANA